MRPAVLENNLFIRPQRYYGDQLVDKTYNALNTLGAVGQVGITLKEADSPQDSACLDADIKLTKSNIYHFQFGVDGTNTAGDFGVASYVSFQQKNLFRGAEMLSFKLTGAFERIKGNEEYNLETDNYYEYGGDVSFSVPRIMLPVMAKYKRQEGASTTFAFGCNWRKRPEYDRQFLSLDWKYSWYTNRKKIFHTFDFYNINYVVSKNTSKWFSAYLERTGNELLKESYKDQFITRSSYSVVYSENSSSGTLKGWSFRGGIDIAGTMPYLFCSALQKGDSVYTIANTPFAQYFKAMFDVSKNFFIKSKTQLVAHVGLGVAMPYGNSLVIPYEQRFFAGGANTLRGWSTRTLGPGSFDSHDSGNFITQTGDVKIVLNLEYRQQTNTFLDVAAFLDAGNIWTVKDYETQKNGQFNIAGFYKEMGFSWGLGIRPNFKFIVLRLDAGMQLFSPTDGWVALHPSWKNTCALHFAVGYPF